MRILLLLIALAGTFQTGFSQEAGSGKLLRQARKHTLKGRYEEARTNYLELVKRHPDHFVYNYELGVNYFYFTVDNKAEAIPYLEKALAGSKAGDTLPELFYMLGETHHLAGNLDKASSYYQRLKPYLKDNDEGQDLMDEINRKIAQISYGKAFAISRNDSILIENLGGNINSKYSEYVPVVNQEESILMFTSRRSENTGKRRDAFDEQYFEDMYIARGSNGNFDKAEPFKISDRYIGLVENTPRHDAIVGISADSTLLITYRENSLWQSRLKEDKTWEGPEKMGELINPDKTYTPHGFITRDGRRLFFSSTRKGGAGGLDLYMAEKDGSGTWGEPVSLGSLVNTPLDEDSPFLSPDGTTLYFSSRGHNTMGGYDIFRSKLVNGAWSAPENLGSPINTTGDDIYYLPLNEFVSYFSSNRVSGLGSMDIYRVLYKARPAFNNCIVAGASYSDTTGLSVSLDLSEIEKGKTLTLNPALTVAAGKKLHATFWMAKGEVTESETLNYVAENSGTDSVKVEYVLTDQLGLTSRTCLVYPFTITEPVVVPVDTTPVTPPGYKPVLVYFDLNKSVIDGEAARLLDEQVAQLKANPEFKVTLTGHTDVRGSETHNQALSVRRAKAVKSYLLAKGVKASQIVAVTGMGEKKPVNRCVEGVECSDEEHYQNRRTEVLLAK